MTVTVAFVDSRGAWIAADSCSSNSSTRYSSETPKIGRFGDLLIGYAGSWSGGRKLFNFIDKNYKPPYEWDVPKIFDEFSIKDKDLSALVVCRGHLYLYDDGACVEILRVGLRRVAYAAIGTGENLALGALFAGGSIEEAVQAAITFDPSVEGPVVQLEMRPNGEEW